MCRILKYGFLKVGALAVATAPVLVLLVWYALSFLTHLGELQSISARGQKIVASTNPAFYKLAELGETKDGIRSYAIRQSYWSLIDRKKYWGLTYWLWLESSYLHFSDKEVFGIWVECSLYGCGHGLMEASEKYFGKPITDLTVDELAGLVALMKSPMLFAPNTVRGEERKLNILKKYHAGLQGK